MNKQKKTNSKISLMREFLIYKLQNLDTYFLLISLVVIFVYNLTFYNKFYPLTEGWFSTYAWLMNHGQFPYRDFYMFLTPLYVVIMSIFTAIFGYSILYLRIFGIMIILLMTYFLYKNFQIIFGSAIACFVSVVGIIYYQSNNAHITYDFIQIMTLFGLIQSYFLLRYVSHIDTDKKSQIKDLFWAGVFACLAFLTKQSNGAIITVFSFIGLFLLTVPYEKRKVVKPLAIYICGFLVPLLITIFWLVINSALPQFVSQIFTGAVSSKGGLDHIFFSWLSGVLTDNFVVRSEELLQIVVVLGYWVYFFTDKKIRDEKIKNIFFIIASVAVFFAVLLPFFINKTTVQHFSLFGETGINNIIVAAIAIPVLAIILSAFLFITKKPFDKGIFLFSFISLGFIYGTGASAGITEVGAFTGFCLFIALMLKYPSILGIGKIFIVLFCLSFCLMLIESKYEQPYFWWNMTSPDIRTQLYTTNKIPELKGIYTSKYNITLLEKVSEAISEGSKPGDSVVIFPNIPIFYLIADRRPPGKALVYWFDFLPDNLAIKEAQVIRKNPPKVIVYLDLGPEVWTAHEQLFRGGKPSGQRQIDKSIKYEIRAQKMHATQKFTLSQGVTLTVWEK